MRVTTATGTFEAKQLVIAAGAWASQLVPSLAAELSVERNVLSLVRTDRPSATHSRDCRSTSSSDTDRIFYGFPYIEGQGVKVAGLHFGDKADPDTVDRTVSEHDEERVRAWLRRRMPLANGQRRDAKVCMYTNTHDANFIVDRLADHPNVVVASACSGPRLQVLERDRRDPRGPRARWRDSPSDRLPVRRTASFGGESAIRFLRDTNQVL